MPHHTQMITSLLILNKRIIKVIGYMYVAEQLVCMIYLY